MHVTRMSSFLERTRFFNREERSAERWSALLSGDREWESFYRRRWQHDRVVRSTHGVNCTGSCSWKIHVKDGIVAWETQQTDYPSNGADVPEYEPRGCPRGASFSWYLYSPIRVRYPYVRGALIEMWREALAATGDPVEAWASIVEDPGEGAGLQEPARQGRLRPLELGRGDRHHGRRPRPHDRASTGPTASPDSRRSPPCRWSRTPPAPGSCR